MTFFYQILKHSKHWYTSCGSLVKASTKSSESDVQAAKCNGVIPPGPARFGGKTYFLEVVGESSVE